VSTPPPDPNSRVDERSLGELVIDVSERVTILVREEIELAKAEISEKLTKLLTGSVVGIVAGALAFLGFIMLMHAVAWLLNDLFFESSPWLGFLIEAVLWFVVAAVAGMLAYRAVRAGTPPAPTMAIEEAKEIRETLEAGSDG
jgi:uncharacterized membrane protein YqjE